MRALNCSYSDFSETLNTPNGYLDFCPYLY